MTRFRFAFRAAMIDFTLLTLFAMFVIAFMFLVLIASAHAQTVVASSPSNLSSFTSIFDSVLAAFMSAVVGLAGLLLNKFVKDTSSRASLTAALNVAAGVVAQHAQADGDQFLQNTSVKNAALAKGLNYLADQIPDAIKYWGLSPADLSTKLEAVVATHLGLATPIPTVTTPVVTTTTEVPVPAAVTVAQTDVPPAATMTPTAL